MIVEGVQQLPTDTRLVSIAAFTTTIREAATTRTWTRDDEQQSGTNELVVQGRSAKYISSLVREGHTFLLQSSPLWLDQGHDTERSLTFDSDTCSDLGRSEKATLTPRRPDSWSNQRKLVSSLMTIAGSPGADSSGHFCFRCTVTMDRSLSSLSSLDVGKFPGHLQLKLNLYVSTRFFFV